MESVRLLSSNFIEETEGEVSPDGIPLHALYIDGEYNIEIPEILHEIFLYSTARDIVKMTRVSRTFQMVGTTDLLWEEVIKNINEYFPETSIIAKYIFFYDVKNKKNDLFLRMQKKFEKANNRKKRFDKKQKRDKIKKYTKDSISWSWTIFLWGVTISSAFLFPPLSALGQGIIASRKVYWSEEVDEYGVLFAATVCDSLCCFVLVSGLTLFGFIPGVACASFNLLVWVGRLYRRMGDPEYLYLLSPSVLCFIFSVVFIGISFVSLACCCLCIFGICQTCCLAVSHICTEIFTRRAPNQLIAIN